MTDLFVFLRVVSLYHCGYTNVVCIDGWLCIVTWIGCRWRGCC